MPIRYLDFKELPQISPMDLAYATEREGLSAFYKYEPNLDSFKDVIKDKSKNEVDRQLLVSRLKAQYEALENSDQIQGDLIDSLLDDQTFTITTAHQPSLFTGPLYFIYKAFSAIKLAQMLKMKYEDFQFVPIFILGGEDHDFEEINHLHVQGQKIEWKNQESGSVSRMKTDSLGEVLTEMDRLRVHNGAAQPVMDQMKKAFTEQDTYGLAMAKWVQQLLGSYGILVLNMDDVELKRAMIPVFLDELVNSPSEPLVLETQQRLKDAGYGNQAFPRKINLFYMKEGLRERIEKQDGVYHVLNTSLEFSEAEILKELETHPERFSPNVVLRPIYQESILPNLAYVGGGGELAYWLERSSQFKHFGINFPMLVRRDSVIWKDRSTGRKMDKMKMTIQDLALRPEDVIKKYLNAHSKSDFSIENERSALQSTFDQLANKAKAIDPTLGPMVESQREFHLKRLDHLGGKLRKAEQRKHQSSLDSLQQLSARIFPSGSLQERYDNFLTIYLEEGPWFFDQLLEHLDPLDTRVKVLFPE